jgi:hypothetical protein
MQFLSSLSSAVISASTAALSNSNSIPGLNNFSLADQVIQFNNKSIWSLYNGIKKVFIILLLYYFKQETI